MLQILYSGMPLLQPGTAGIPWWELESLKVGCRMHHLEKASLFCFGSAPLVTNPSSGEHEGPGQTNSGEGRKEEHRAASSLPGLMQQDEAKASSLCRILHPAVRSQILEDIAPLTTWCHVIIIFGI